MESHFDRFIKYAGDEIGKIDGDSIFKGPDSLDDIGRNLYGCGRYVIDQAREVDPEVEVATSNKDVL
jgi:hypothetical protein